MTSRYDELLVEAKTKASILAKDYIPLMYKELVEVEKLDPKDAGERIKKDLVDTWSPVTIRANLPDAAKHEEKVRTKNDIEESEKPLSQIVLEQSTNGSSTKVEGVKYLGDVLGQYKERENAQKQDYDKLAEQYNETQEKLEGIQTHNEFLQDEVKQLKEAIQALQTARPNLVQATRIDSKVQQATRNPNRGFWIRFDLSNVEITRPLINIIMRMKDRPKEFFIEVLGDDVIEVSENKQ
jgi:vacuolar-type H+-ATPase subunit I/STV1